MPSQAAPFATSAPAAELVQEVFRLHGPLSAAADGLIGDLGTTVARWQVLNTVAEHATPQPVAWIARTLGVSRQNVQRLVNELATDRLVRLDPNPHHKRAKLVVLTPRGRKVRDDAKRRQTPWASTAMAGLTQDQIANALYVLRTLRTRLATD